MSAEEWAVLGDDPMLRLVVDGSLLRKRELLACIDGLDVTKQRGLLRVAVRVGEVNSVIILLGKEGVDPCEVYGGEGGLPLLELAERLAREHPEDEGRRSIAQLLRIACDKRRSTGLLDLPGAAAPSASEGGEDSSAIAMLTEMMSSLCVLVQGLQSQGASSSSQKDEQEVALLRKHHFAMQEGLKGLKETIGDGVDGLRVALALRDASLERLESKVDSLSEEVRPIVKFLDSIRTKASAEGGTGSAKGMRMGDFLGTEASEEELHERCVEALMSRTEFLKRKDEHVKLVRELYEILLTTSPSTACLARYLEHVPSVQIAVDCESYYVEDMKQKLTDVAGRAGKGSSCYTHADLPANIVYLGAKVSSSWGKERLAGQLAMSLAQVCFHLAFDNGGRPYGSEDAANRLRCSQALEQIKAEDWLIEDSYFDEPIKKYMGSECLLEKQVCLTAAVPGMVATFGPKDGELRCRRKLKPLARFYEDHVVESLVRRIKLYQESG